MATRADTGVLAREGKVSLVDSAEHALRTWLATGRHRPGERLPPEQELSARLGISRGTLRTALRRLEKTGEIVRRQGSGTYVGRASSSTTLDEGLEKLVSYYELARRRGVKIELKELAIEERRLGPELGRVFDLAPDSTATAIERVLLIDGTPGACMTDVVHPDVSLPTNARLRQALERGQMVLDVLLKQDVPVAYARTHVTARLVTGRDRIGRALNVTGTTAALDIEELTCTADGAVVEHSTDIFLPTSLDLHVMRWLEDTPPVPALERR